MRAQTYQTVPSTRRNLLFIAAAALIAVSFFAGMHYQSIEAILGSAVGIKRSTKTLDLSSVQQTYQYLVANYDGKVDSSTLIAGANQGMVNALGDKYTVYLTADQAKKFDDDLSGNVGAGIGAQVQRIDGKITLGRILPDNPAARAGLKQGDIIQAINGESTAEWDVDTAVAKIKGEPGTSVKLEVLRASQTKTYTLTRATINNPSVISDIKNGVGILTITRFDADTGALAAKAAQTFKHHGVKGVIVDIRSDDGGYIDAAVTVAGLWLDNKTVVTQRVGDRITDTRTTSSDATLGGLKTYVLINGGSASASEILASALRDNGAAKLLGEKSFGKGSVQQVFDLASGAELKVTVAKWYTPKGHNINGDGLVPDTEVKLTNADISAGRDPQLEAALRLLGAA